VATAPSVAVFLNICDNSRFVGSQVSHVFFLFFIVVLKREPFIVVCVVGLDFFFFVAPLFSLLAVFYQASAFNQDVSNWNTGAVTNMYQSK
jgi:surface protein